MERWRKILEQGICTSAEAAKVFNLDEEAVHRVASVFPLRISPEYRKLIGGKGDPIYLQCVPDGRELQGNEALLDDPLGEEEHSPAPNVVQRYPDRCLLLVSNECATYCRFCTRKRKFRSGLCVDREHVFAGIDFIRRTPAIRDVLISGGDPFLLDDGRLEEILRELRGIEHVEILRIGTRTPCMLPERITVKLVKMLRKYHPLYLSCHFNHPDELTPKVVGALGRLADAGIPLGCQTVLLKGVNDDVSIMRKLMRKLLLARVRPYYIFQCDLVYGTEHFRVPLRKGLEIMKGIQGYLSGLAVPHYAIDMPGGSGKVLLLPRALRNVDGARLTFENFRSELHDYVDIEEFKGDL
ncbi:MAG: KamA family radical SAM protein [Victivallaceae bacterium]|nr:KamA family radical SAM protein [Victivallaceae bacterium]